jgi:hypothetical protein
MANNVKILGHLSDAINTALDSTRVLDRAFGPSQAAHGARPASARLTQPDLGLAGP